MKFKKALLHTTTATIAICSLFTNSAFAVASVTVENNESTEVIAAQTINHPLQYEENSVDDSYEVESISPLTSTTQPVVHNLMLTDAPSSLLINSADKTKRGFESSVKTYDVYFVPSQDTFSFNMLVNVASGDDYIPNISVNGTQINGVDNDLGYITTYTFEAKNIDVVDENAVTIEIKNGSLSNIYTINMHKVDALPIIGMNLESKNNGITELQISLKNTMVNSFGFKLKLDPENFVGFIGSDGQEYVPTGGTETLLTQIQDSMKDDLNSNFQVEAAEYDADNNTISIIMAPSETATVVDCTTTTYIGKLRFLTSSNKQPTLEQLKTLEIDDDFVWNTLSDERFNTFVETTTDINDGLIHITLPETMLVMGYVNTLMNKTAQMDQAQVVLIKDGGVYETYSVDATGFYMAEVYKGEYDVEITVTNYVKAAFKINETTGIIGSKTLIAGDVEVNDLVNTDDRTKLAGMLFSVVGKKGDLGDIDGNGIINGSDLGYLLANMK